MMHRRFSIRRCASYGWRTTFSNFGLSLLIALVVVVLVGLSRFIEKLAPSMPAGKEALAAAPFSALFLYFFVVLYSFIVFPGIYLGLIKLALEWYDKGTTRLSLLFSQFRLLPKAYGGWILLSLFLGALFLPVFFSMAFTKLHPVFMILTVLLFPIALIFNFFFSIRFSFFEFALIDKHVGVIGSLRKSFRLTCGNVWKLIIFYFVVVLSAITVIGIPAAALMLVAAYRSLLGMQTREKV